MLLRLLNVCISARDSVPWKSSNKVTFGYKPLSSRDSELLLILRSQNRKNFPTIMVVGPISSNKVFILESKLTHFSDNFLLKMFALFTRFRLLNKYFISRFYAAKTLRSTET